MLFVDAALFPQSNTGHFLWNGHVLAYSYYITTFLLHHLTACIRDRVGVFLFLFLNLEAEKRLKKNTCMSAASASLLDLPPPALLFLSCMRTIQNVNETVL